jgi:HSP20 family protein
MGALAWNGGALSQMPSMFNNFFNDDWFKYSFDKRKTRARHTSAHQLKDNGDCYRVELAVPGLSRSDIRVEANANTLTIDGYRRRSTAPFSMRSYAIRVIHHTIAMPEDADMTSVKAKCRRGLLTLSVKKINNSRAIQVEGDPQPVDRSVANFFQRFVKWRKRCG